MLLFLLIINLALAQNDALCPLDILFKCEVMPFSDKVIRNIPVKGINLEVFQGKVKVADSNVYVVNQTLRVDYRTTKGHPEDLRGFLFGKILGIYTKTSILPQRFSPNSKNSKAFFEQLPSFPILKRAEIIKAIYQIPGVKLHERFGFSKLSKILIHPELKAVAIFSEKGNRLDESAVKIIVKGKEFGYHSMNEKGKISPVKNQEDTRLGDYVDLDPWN